MVDRVALLCPISARSLITSIIITRVHGMHSRSPGLEPCVGIRVRRARTDAGAPENRRPRSGQGVVETKCSVDCV